jgi:hypothetical protein
MNRTLECQHLDTLYPQCPELYPHPVHGRKECSICAARDTMSELHRPKLRWWQRIIVWLAGL